MTSGFHPDRHIGQHEANALEVGNWLSESSALSRIGHCLVKRPASDAYGSGCNSRSALVECLHGYSKALALIAQEVACRDLYIFEKHLAGLCGVLAHFRQRFACAHSGPVPFNHKATDAVMACIRVGLCKDGEEAGDRAVCDPGLGPVQKVGVLTPQSCGLDAGDV